MIAKKHVFVWSQFSVDQHLDGDFSFILWDSKKKEFIAARDPLGVNTLYWGTDSKNCTWFASELKALKDDVTTFATFPPGHYYTKATGFVRYYNPVWLNPQHIPTAKPDYKLIRETFENAVKKRMMTDVPYGVLLSGGLDSSLVASVASRFAPARVEEGGKTKAWWSTLHTFAIGLKVLHLFWVFDVS